MTALNLKGRARWVDFRGVPKAGWDVFYAALKADGVTGAIRYIDGGSESKQVTSAERQAANRHGRKLLLVDETGTGDAWDAADDLAAGKARGRGALADAKAQGFGAVGIAAAADAHATARQVADAVQYAKGFASIVGKAMAGFYGFMEVLRAVRAAGLVTWYWAAGSMPSAEDGKWLAFWQDNRTRVYYAGVECDINWRLDGPLPGGSGSAAIEEDDMQPNDLFNAKVPKDGNFVVPGDGTFRHWMAYVYQIQRRNADVATTLAAQSKAIAALAADPNIDEAKLAALIDDAVATHTPTAQENAAQMLPLIEQIVREAVPAEIADNVVAKIGAALNPEGATA